MSAMMCESGDPMREMLFFGPKGLLDQLLASKGVGRDQIVSITSADKNDVGWQKFRVLYHPRRTMPQATKKPVRRRETS
jgi:hypothetical protein